MIGALLHPTFLETHPSSQASEMFPIIHGTKISTSQLRVQGPGLSSASSTSVSLSLDEAVRWKDWDAPFMAQIIPWLFLCPYSGFL